MKKLIKNLKPHPLNRLVYGTHNKLELENLTDNIKRLGLLEPILVTDKNIILSGHRRLEACKILKKKYIECKIISVSEEEQIYYIISGNKQRVKDYVVRVQEIEYLTEYYTTNSGLADERRSLLSGSRGDRKTTRQLIAEDLSISSNTISQLNFIKKNRPDILEFVGESITLAAAYTQVKLWEN